MSRPCRLRGVSLGREEAPCRLAASVWSDRTGTWGWHWGSGLPGDGRALEMFHCEHCGGEDQGPEMLPRQEGVSLALECLGEGVGAGSLGREAPPCLPHSGEGGSETKGISRSSRHGNFSEHQCQCAVWPRVEAAASGSLCTPGPAPSALREGGVCPQREAWQGASSQIQAEPWSWGHPGLQEKAMVSSHASASFSSHCGPSRRQEEKTSGQNASPPCLHPQPGPSGRGWEDTHELTS